jgi:hypothetical protein
MTVDPVFTRCSKLATLREEIWPKGTEVQDQLLGDLEQVHHTMNITEAEL